MAKKRIEWELALKLRGASPETLPLERLGDYLREFARLMGSSQSIHFAGMVKGSALLRAEIPQDSRADVMSRLALVSTGETDAKTYASKIDDMMRADGWDGAVVHKTGATIIQFPGAKARVEPRPDLVSTQEDEISGVVMRIGGKDDTVPLLIRDVNDVYYEANIIGKDLARELAKHLFGSPVRLYGRATWKKPDGGRWALARFAARSFELLDDTSAGELLAKLAASPDNEWKNIPNPIEEWQKIRG